MHKYIPTERYMPDSYTGASQIPVPVPAHRTGKRIQYSDIYCYLCIVVDPLGSYTDTHAPSGKAA